MQQIRPERSEALNPVLHHWDVVNFTIAAVVTIRLIPVAAAAGPSIVCMWLLAAFAFYIPVAVASVVLSRQLPGPGGVYIWTKVAFGDLHGFITAWTYWTSSLVFFPSVLIFTSTQAAFILPGKGYLAENPVFLNVVSIASIACVLWLNVSGMRAATWFHNVSTMAIYVVLAAFAGFAIASWFQSGTATSFALAAWVPDFTGLENLLFFSSIVYMLSGAECASQLGDEVHEAQRTMPRAQKNDGLIITGIYILASLALLVCVSADELSGLTGFGTAVSITARRIGGDSFGGLVEPVMAILLFVGHLGTFSVWFAATARLPFVVGLDRYLPAAFGRVHPHYGSPHVALVTLAIATAMLVLLSSLGGAAAQVYQVLISLEIAIYFIPYLYLFAALIKLQMTRPAGLEAASWVNESMIYLIAAVGFVVTAGSLALALIPGAEVESPARFYAMLFGSLAANLVIGAGLYLWGKRHRSER